MRSKLQRILLAASALVLFVFLAIAALPLFQPTNETHYVSKPHSAMALPTIDLPQGLVNVNTATEELLTLPGIGETTAEAFLAERKANGPFFFPSDLLAVKGIGEKKLGELLPHICFVE